MSGDYAIHLFAFGSGTAEAVVSTRVYLSIPTNDPPNTIIPAAGSDLVVADAQRSRLYFGGQYGITIIDTTTMTVVKTIGDRFVIDMALSADGNRLWFVSTNINLRLARVDLDNLDNIVQVPISEPIQFVREGPNHRLYISAYNGDIIQLDPATGVIEQRFRPSPGSRANGPPKIEFSPDRRTLYVADSFYIGNSLNLGSSLSRYSFDTGTPALAQRVDMAAPYFWSMLPAPNGQSIYVVPGSGWGYWGTYSTLCLAAQDLSQVQGTFSYRGSSKPPTLSPDGKFLLQSVIRSDGGVYSTGFVEVFDTTTFALLKTLVVGTVTSAGVNAEVFMSSTVADKDYSRLFVWVSTNDGIPVGTGTFGLCVYTTEAPPPRVTPDKSLLNLATRMVTDRGDNALIGGFIVTGNIPKGIIARALGPSLPLAGKLQDPILELYDSTGKKVAENDNWNSDRQNVLATGIPPSDDHEAALVATLQAGRYTVMVRGADDNAGIATVEIYDLNPAAGSRIANLSTRGRVGTADDVMIGGVILGGTIPTNIVVRGIGPSLQAYGVGDSLIDPMLTLYDGNGAILAQNDDWAAGDAKQLSDFGLAPTNDKESALFLSLTPGNYTAILRGKDGGTGVGLVEFYNLQ